MEAKSSGRKIIIISSLIILVVISLTFLIFNYTYSEGNRAGVVVKISKKGYLLKTYEGELNMGGMGNLPNTAQMNMQWNFSVNDQAVADTLMNLEGRKVSLHYKEIIKNMPWQGETKYFVDGVKLIKD
jgi:hypothetical protein